ncbi:hypothetical protein HMI56_007198, partial [Coelomomyces lativittatus]
ADDEDLVRLNTVLQQLLKLEVQSALNVYGHLRVGMGRQAQMQSCRSVPGTQMTPRSRLHYEYLPQNDQAVYSTNPPLTRMMYPNKIGANGGNRNNQGMTIMMC